MQPKEFKRQLDELGRVISDGIAYFVAWRVLMVEDEDSAHALNRYRGLFLSARSALLGMALMQFAKVFDKDPRAVSLRNLLGLAKENRENLTPHATDGNLLDIDRKIEDSESLLHRLKCYRDQRLAHHDSTVTGDTRLLYGEVTKLIEETKSMYNSLTRAHERASMAFEFLGRETERHTSEVVRIMREDRERAARRIKETDISTT